jgi:tetratricopeptide (TPR) repeat protein
MLINMIMVAGLACADLPAVTENFDSTVMDIDAVSQLAEREPDCLEAHVVHGRMLMRQGTVEGKEGAIDAGVAVFENAVTLMPDNSMLHTWLGRALLSRASAESSLSDAKAAVRTLERAIEIDPLNFEAREALASFHRNAPWIAGGDIDVAEEQAEFVAQHDARLGLEMRIRNLMADGDEDEAIELMKDALAEQPDWDEMAVQLAIAYHGEGDYSNAFNVLSQRADIPEPDPMVVYQLGRTAALSGDFLDAGRQAMQRYIEMLDADPDLDIPAAAAWWRLGMIEEHAGDVSAARIAYQKALEIDPDHEAAQDALDDLD